MMENIESQVLTLVKELSSLATEVKYLREDMYEIKKDIRILCDSIPKTCADCDVRTEFDAYKKAQKEKIEEDKSKVKFRWDIAGILAAIILSFAALMFSVVTDVRDSKIQSTVQVP
jgi:hypothetical protein